MSDDNSAMLLLLFFIVIIYIFYQIRFVDIKKSQPIYIQPRRYRPHGYRPQGYRPHRYRPHSRAHQKKIIKVDPIMPLVRPDIKK
jgi:hypothetical protein